MAPYASTWSSPIVESRCHYLYNIDHPQFRASFDMLDGKPRENWRFSVVLRRIFYPLIAYPFMKALGFENGGFLASLLLQLAALALFARAMARRFGERAGVASAWLLATWPGITYWAALPYSYVALVPASLASYALLVELEEAESTRTIALCSAGLGLAFTAYDLWPFFAPALVWLLARRRRWRALAVALPLALGPMLLAGLAVALASGKSGNVDSYARVANAWLHPGAGWGHALAEVPASLLAAFFASSFVAWPALFLLALALGARPTRVEKLILAAAALLFAFTNLAPPYGGWQLRGPWIARLYEPIAVVFLAVAARAIAAATGRRKQALLAAAALAIAFDASVMFGPIARVPWSDFAYQRFYQHAPVGTMTRNLDRWGRRPLGVCN
jgi:hypothetical protein